MKTAFSTLEADMSLITKDRRKKEASKAGMYLKTQHLTNLCRNVIGNKVIYSLAALLSAVIAVSCSGSGNSSPPPSGTTIAPPVFSTTAAQNGAVILAISSAGSGATVHYTIDGSAPTSSSPVFQTPMLISSNLTIKAIATASGTSSSVAIWTPQATVAPGALAWSDEFTNTTGANAQPNPAVWTYDTGANGWATRNWKTTAAGPPLRARVTPQIRTSM